MTNEETQRDLHLLYDIQRLADKKRAWLARRETERRLKAMQRGWMRSVNTMRMKCEQPGEQHSSKYQ